MKHGAETEFGGSDIDPLGFITPDEESLSSNDSIDQNDPASYASTGSVEIARESCNALSSCLEELAANILKLSEVMRTNGIKTEPCRCGSIRDRESARSDTSSSSDPVNPFEG